jgi:hypothetical protein
MPSRPQSPGGAYGSNDEHLRDELHRAGGLVRAQLLRYRLATPEPQRERFWHLPDDYLDEIARDSEHAPLSSIKPPGSVTDILGWVDDRRAVIDRRIAATRTIDLRLVRLAREFALTSREVDGLLLAWLPVLHSTYRRWYGVLQHDPSKALATVGLLTEMLATSSDDYAALLTAFAPGSRLAASRLLVHAGTDDEPLTLRPVQIEDRITRFLFGADSLDPRIEQAVRWFEETVDLRALPIPDETANRLEMLPNLGAAEPEVLPRLRLAFLGPDAGLAVRAFAAVAAGLGRRVLIVDVPAALAGGASWPLAIDGALREARLGGGLPLFTGVASLYEQGEHTPRLEHLLSRLAAFPHPAAVDAGLQSGEDGRALPGWIPFRLAVPTIAMREKRWAALLAGGSNQIGDRAGTARDLANAFQLTDSQIRESWRTAGALARRRNVFIASIDRDDLFAACRQQSARRLVAFAQRLEPRGHLTLEKDLVLPPANKRALFELSARIRNHGRVHGAMALGDHMRLGRGVTALFVGGSGTGKTMAAEVLASEHQIDLYRIDLAALVSKWVGETEKNLSRIFADAERANCMLFFDEADAMFGHRGEVKEARDRWANLEVNYLLQRIEEYSGVVILATNLRQNIDEAFQRRIHAVVEFPSPDAALRHEIWQRLLPPAPHCGVDAPDLGELAQRFELTGGSIRNVVLDACFRALEGGAAAITTRQLIAGTAREYQKMSRPVTQGEFGRFYSWAMRDVIAPDDVATVSGA